MNALFRLAACLALPLSLSACWKSEGPLMPESVMVQPPIDGKWKSERGGVFRADRNGKGFDVYVSDWKTHEWRFERKVFLAKTEEPDIFLAETFEGDDRVPSYVIVKYDPKRGLAYLNPDCTNLEKADPRIVFDDSFDDGNGQCIFSTYRVLDLFASIVIEQGNGFDNLEPDSRKFHNERVRWFTRLPES